MGYKEGLDEAKTRLKSLEGRLLVYNNKMEEHDREVETVRSELKDTDELLHKLRPNFQLDSLDDRCKQMFMSVCLSVPPLSSSTHPSSLPFLLYAIFLNIFSFKMPSEGEELISSLKKTMSMQPLSVPMATTNTQNRHQSKHTQTIDRLLLN